MATFGSRNRSIATVPVSPERIWEVLTDPGLLAELTPLVDHITARGDVWTWQLAGISGLGLEVAPAFTERMTFVPISLIEFRHDPPPGRTERAGVDGTYRITRVEEGSSKLAIDLTMCVELPMPRVAAPVVERIIATTMGRTGDAFSRNLYRHLGLDPDTIRVRVVEGEGAT